MDEIPHDRRGDMSKRHVSIVKTGSRPDYDAVLAAVRKSIDLIGGLDDVVKSGQMVLINPSWVAAPAGPNFPNNVRPTVLSRWAINARPKIGAATATPRAARPTASMSFRPY
jgi:uncharacterized protein (DUF362 family)